MSDITNNIITIGHVVYLRGQIGQLMTVIAVDSQDLNSFICAYFMPDGYLRRESIRHEALVRYA